METREAWEQGRYEMEGGRLGWLSSSRPCTPARGKPGKPAKPLSS